MKKSFGDKLFVAIDIIIIFALCLVCIYPFLYSLFVSLSDPVELAKVSRFVYKPAGFSLNAYKSVFTNYHVLHSFRNTLFIVFFGVLLEVLITLPTAYVLSRKHVLWRNAIMTFIVLTMYFSGGLIPTYLVVRNYGLYDSLWALIIPVMLNAYNMIIVRTYMAGIHDSLSESAMLDGANHLQILWRIFIPLCQPSIAVLILYSGVNHWNSWFRAFIYIGKSSKYPLQLVLRNLLINGTQQGSEQSNELGLMVGVSKADHDVILSTIQQASVIASTLPIIFIYPLLQKYIVSGIMIGSVKE